MRILLASQMPTFGIVRLLNCNHFSFIKQDLIRFSILIFLITDDLEYLHISINHYYVFCMKCLFKYFAYILLNWVTVFLLSNCKCPLHILNTRYKYCIFFNLWFAFSFSEQSITKSRTFSFWRKPNVLMYCFHGVCFGCPI